MKFQRYKLKVHTNQSSLLFAVCKSSECREHTQQRSERTELETGIYEPNQTKLKFFQTNRTKLEMKIFWTKEHEPIFVEIFIQQY